MIYPWIHFHMLRFIFRLNTRSISFSHSADLIKHNPYFLSTQVHLTCNFSNHLKQVKTPFREMKQVFMKRQSKITILYSL